MNMIKILLILMISSFFIMSYMFIDNAWNLHTHQCFYRYYSHNNTFELRDRNLYLNDSATIDEIYRQGLIVHDLTFIAFIFFVAAVYYED